MKNDRASRFLRVACPVTVLALTPLAFTWERGVVENEACAQSGTCCPEAGSTCVIGNFSRADAYYKPSGSCKDVDGT